MWILAAIGLVIAVAAVFIGGMVGLLAGAGMILNSDNPYPELATLRSDPAAKIRPADGVLLWTYELERTTTIDGDKQAADLSFAYGTDRTDTEVFAQLVSSVGLRAARQTEGPPPNRISALFCRGEIALSITIADPSVSERVVRDVRRTNADPKRFRAIAIVSLTAADYAQQRDVCRAGPSPSPTR